MKKFKRIVALVFTLALVFITGCEKSNASKINITQELSGATNVFVENIYTEFKANAEKEFLIPALKQGFVPQGMDIWQDKNLAVISGYFESNDEVPSSMIVTVDLATNNLVGKYCLINMDGSFHTSHVGGVTITQKNLYLSNGSTLYKISLSQIESKNNVGDLKIEETFKTATKGSFCNYSGGYLWVGDFYYNSQAYQTPEWRHILNSDGTTHKAWAVGYKLNQSGELEYDGTSDYVVPDVVLSITDKIQSFTMSDDKIYLSQSYGSAYESSILSYNNVLKQDNDLTVNLLGVDVPLWYLDTNDLVKDLKAPPMSEGISIYNNRLYILFESGATKFLRNNSTDYVWSIPL